jgi:osmotically-inducible protein OsmY
MRTFVTAAALSAMFVIPAAFGADESAPAYAKTHFDASVDTWAEGTVMAVDADAGSLTLRGVKRPYATSYAAMLKEIHADTADLPPAEAQKKESEIRAKWQETLAKARTTDPAANDSDFTFYLPKEKSRISYFDESRFYDREQPLAEKDQAANAEKLEATEYEKQALMQFKNLKVGERLSVGYDSGLVYNTMHVIVKVRDVSDDAVKATKASYIETRKTDDTGKPATALSADDENARQIRKSLVNDDALSITARNVVIQAQNGTVTLKGAVASQQEKEAVQKKAAAVVGETRVINELEISTR